MTILPNKAPSSQGSRFLIVAGTRPEAIKLAPIYLAFREMRPADTIHWCSTGQHTDMLDSVLENFGIRADYQFRLLRPDTTLTQMAGTALHELNDVIEHSRPDWLICQGDTTSAFCAALAAFYSGVKVAHVEAGLRTYDLAHPYPEEGNRRLIAPLADQHFAPTLAARDNLLTERIPQDMIRVTGNTGIDAMRRILEAPETDRLKDFKAWFESNLGSRRFVLITGHRRENWGAGLENLCAAVRQVMAEQDDIAAVYPLHLNPKVQTLVGKCLGGEDRAHLIPPLDYPEFIWLMSRATIILTDSGGIQEEAPALGKPVLVFREKTERPEGVAAGTAKLVGTRSETISHAVLELLTDQSAYDRMAKAVNPYGDGYASERIVADLCPVPDVYRQSAEAIIDCAA